MTTCCCSGDTKEMARCARTLEEMTSFNTNCAEQLARQYVNTRLRNAVRLRLCHPPSPRLVTPRLHTTRRRGVTPVQHRCVRKDTGVHHPLPRARFEGEAATGGAGGDGKKAGGKGWGAGAMMTETGTPLNAFQRSLVPLE